MRPPDNFAGSDAGSRFTDASVHGAAQVLSSTYNNPDGINVHLFDARFISPRSVLIAPPFGCIKSGLLSGLTNVALAWPRRRRGVTTAHQQEPRAVQAHFPANGGCSKETANALWATFNTLALPLLRLQHTI